MVEKRAKDLRQSFLNDPSRPIYHYLPPSNWMNDPNGLIQWKGKYHLFYQYNPDAAIHRNMHWGHAHSDDLIHWQDMPVALAPSPGTDDEGGIFSGSAIDNDGTAMIFYTGVNKGNTHQAQYIASSRDELLETWTKYDSNPVIAAAPADAKQTQDFRDPFVWKDDETWYMLVGSEIAGQGGVVFLYCSEDASNWEYMHPLLAADDDSTGDVWECPNFFKLGEKWVLIISTNSNDITGDVLYFVGRYENFRFVPEHQGILDYAYLYAPLTISDDQGRRLLWGWIREGRTQNLYSAGGWAGVQSIPRELSLDENNNLLTEPVPELEGIRQKHTHSGALPGTDKFKIEMRGLAVDIEARFEIKPESVISVRLACSEDDSISTEIRYDASSQLLTVNRENSSQEAGNDRHTHQVEHSLEDGETLDLRILLDHSVVEIIANKRSSLTTRIYPSSFDDNYVRISGENVIPLKLDIYEMPSIWSLETD